MSWGVISCITNLVPHCGSNQWIVSMDASNGKNVSIGAGSEEACPRTFIPLLNPLSRITSRELGIEVQCTKVINRITRSVNWLFESMFWCENDYKLQIYIFMLSTSALLRFSTFTL